MQFKKHDRRQVQVEKQIRESLAEFLLKNLNVAEDGLVSVTKVLVPRDLKTAQIFVHQFGKSEDQQDALLEKLERRTGLVQKHISQDLKLRFCPRLEFRYDTLFEKTLAVDRLIHDLGLNQSKEATSEQSVAD